MNKATGAANSLLKTFFGACDASGVVESELSHKNGYLYNAINGTATPITGQANANSVMVFSSTRQAFTTAGDRALVSQIVNGLRDAELELTTSTIVSTKVLIGGRPTASAVTNNADFQMSEFFEYAAGH